MKKSLILLFGVVLLFSCSTGSKENTTESQAPAVVEEEPQAKKILLVLTSHSELGDTGLKTGFWLEEFAAPYYYLVDRGVEVTLASPKGGNPPIDPKSELPDFQTPSTQRFYEDTVTQAILAQTVALSSVKQADFDAIF